MQFAGLLQTRTRPYLVAEAGGLETAWQNASEFTRKLPVELEERICVQAWGKLAGAPA